jgi:hypothetical protein
VRDEDADDAVDKKGGSGVVQSSGAAHTAACVALQRSPALPEFILTVGDWTFCIFKTGVKVRLSLTSLLILVDLSIIRPLYSCRHTVRVA